MSEQTNFKFTAKIQFDCGTEKLKYCVLERTIEGSGNDWLNVRQWMRDTIFNALFDNKAVFSVLQNDTDILSILVNSNAERCDEIIHTLRQSVFVEDVNESHLIYPMTHELRRVSSLTELQDYLALVTSKQAQQYIYVFMDDITVNPLAIIVYLDIPATVPVQTLGVRNVWTYNLSNDDILVGQPNPLLETTVTHFDIANEDGVKVLKWLSDLSAVQEQIRNPGNVEQHHDEGDNEALEADLLLQDNKLYHFYSDNEHAIRVFEHSVVHHGGSFIMYHDEATDMTYVYIGRGVDKRFEEGLVKTQLQKDIQLAAIELNNINAHVYRGLGVVSKTDNAMVRDIILSLMVAGRH